MTELTLAIVDNRTGSLLLDSENAEVAGLIADDLGDTLGEPDEMGCARPIQILHPNPEWDQPAPHIRISGFWHDSLVEGPGRRSVVRMQGCPIRCAGCWVPQTHDPDGGYNVSIDWLADALLDPKYARDGVTILGGEPFAQPVALARLVNALIYRQPDLHITVYSGFTMATLVKRQSPFVMDVLSSISILIDGPFVAALAGSAGPWTGSGNQHVHKFR